MLTESQQRAYDTLLPFLTGETSARSAVLTGVAGTGKSYLTGKIILDLISDGHRVAVAAPTNKAVRVIKEKVEAQAGRQVGAHFSSIHSLLGLRLIEHEDGNQSCQPLGEPSLAMFDAIVLDECSMIGEQLFNLINEYQENTRILFVGDPAQLPPVADKEDVSQTFTMAEIKVALTEIVRQAEGSDIIRLSTAVRELPVRVQASHLYPLLRDLDVRVLKGDRRMVLEVARMAIERQEDARIIAYMNTTVVYYNKTLHSMFHPGEEPFAVGERALVHQQCEMVGDFGPATLITNEEVTVVGISPCEHPEYPRVRSWAVRVKTDLGDEYSGFIAHDALALEREINELFGKWRTLKQKGQYEEAKAMSNHAWGLRKAFAPLRHTYSITAHKCLPLDSKILTPYGIKSLSDLSVGDSVLSGEGNIRKITEFSKTGKKPQVVISTRSGRTFKSSSEHKFLMPNGGFVEAKDLGVGDFLCLARNISPHQFEFDLDSWGYGYLIGNGCVSYDSNRIDITIPSDSNMLPLLKQFLSKYGDTPRVLAKKDNNAVTLMIENKIFRQEMLTRGVARATARSKKLPNHLSSRNRRANFIRGLMDSDGSCGFDRAVIRYVTTSEDLADGVMLLLQDFGIVASKKHVKATDSYTISISGTDCLLYRDQIGFCSDYRAERLETVCNLCNGKSMSDYIPESLRVREELDALWIAHLPKKKTPGVRKNRAIEQMLRHKNFSFFQLKSVLDYFRNVGIEVPDSAKKVEEHWYFYDPITSLRRAEDVEMADITVEVDHSFIYNGAVVHNSQGSTFDTAILDMENLDKLRSTFTYNRGLYVAMTRPSKFLYIIHD